jgi:CBS domain-containing protein
MHKAFTISPDAPMEDAADMVVRKRAHRICVTDDDGVLLGVVSRGDIMRATIATFQAYMDKQDAKSEAQQVAKGSS